MMTINTRNAQGAYTSNYPREVIEYVRDLVKRGRKYNDVANSVKKKFKYDRFTKSNVAGMVSRLRARGELELTKRCGVKRSRQPAICYDFVRPVVPITLAPIPRPRS
jgi:hypothetical protein